MRIFLTFLGVSLAVGLFFADGSLGIVWESKDLSSVKEKDITKAMWVLKEVELTKDNLDSILEKPGLKPKR